MHLAGHMAQEDGTVAIPRSGCTVSHYNMACLKIVDMSCGNTTAPGNTIVEYIPHKFNRSRGADKTLFQGWPTDQIDQTWYDSYVRKYLNS